jgi:hypothetical protein
MVFRSPWQLAKNGVKRTHPKPGKGHFAVAPLSRESVAPLGCDLTAWPRKVSDVILALSEDQLQWLLAGYDITLMKPHPSLVYQRVS